MPLQVKLPEFLDCAGLKNLRGRLVKNLHHLRKCFGEFTRRIGFAVPLTGIQTTGVVRCDQPRVLDIRARRGKKVDSLPSEILDDVLAKTATLFQ